MYNDKTTREQRLNQSNEPFNIDMSFLKATLLILAIAFVIFSYFTLSNQEFKLEKCKAFNNTNKQIINCYFDK